MIATTRKFDTVMIIDDSTIDRYINAQMILRTHFGQKILQYACAAKALEYLQLHSNEPSLLPQVIFVDIYMPGMSGFEFMDAYAHLPTTLKKHCSVYTISSSIDRQDIQRVAADLNIVAFHEKPISRIFLESISKVAS